MLCCLLAALLLGPFGLWVTPRASKSSAPDCCVDNRRMVLVISVLALIGLCSVMLFLAWSQPVPFRHICSFLVPQ
jgi:hypothetical protein